MARQKLLILFLFCLFSSFCIAQDFDNYKPIRSSGLIPEKFLISSTEKYKKESQEKISEEDEAYIKKAKDKFFLESNFAIDELLLSGKVLFNDPVTVYVNKVMDEVLRSEPDLRKEIEVYVIKSSAVNAFTTNNGFVFVCMGLIAQLENEAQLAYILSHEIIHYKKQHALDNFVEATNIERGVGKYRYHSYSEKLLARSNYSREKETESDLDGLSIYLKTNYDLKTLDGVFDVLEYSHLPYDDIEFKRNFLQTETLIFPDDYFLDKTKEIESNDEDDDELSTHPAVKVRREKIADEIEKSDNKGRKTFLVDRQEFDKVQKISRYEVAIDYIQNREYENALYVAYLLLQENPSSIYLKKIVLNALYGLSKYADADRYFEVHYDYAEIQGNIQQVYHLFSKMSELEMNVTALSYAWNLKKQYPNDIEIKDITADLFESFVTNYYTNIEELADSMPAQNIVQFLPPKEEVKTEKPNEEEPPPMQESKKSKYDKIREKKKKEIKVVEEKDTTDFTKYAFVNELKDTAFVNEFKRQAEARDKKLVEDELKNTKKYRKQLKRQERQNNLHGYALGLDKVVFISPFYYKLSERKNEVKRTDSEKAQKLLHEKLEENANLTGLNYVMIDKKDLKETDVETFNDLALLDDFIDLTFENGDIEMTHHSREELLKLSKKYNTRYFCWTGVIAVKKISLGKLTAGCYTVLLYPLAPFFIYKLFRPTYTTSLYTLVLDAQTGKSVFLNKQDYKFTDRDDVLNSAIYDLCLQLKNQRKK